MLTRILYPSNANSTLLTRIRTEVFEKAQKQGKIKVKQIVNIITQRNQTRRAPPSPHHQHLFSENELYCFTGINTTDTEYPELIGFMRTKFPSFPYVPKGPSYREAIRRMRHFSSTGEDLSPLDQIDETYRKIPVFIVFHFLTLSLLYIMTAGRYPSGIPAMIMIWGFIFSEAIRRIFIAIHTYLSVAPSYLKRKIVTTIQSTASTWLTADNLLYSSARGLAMNPVSVMLQLKNISKSNNLQEFVEGFWILGALAGVERSIIHAILSKVLPSCVMTNPNLPPIVTAQGPGDNKSIAFMLAIAAGLLGISTNTIDARLVGTIGGIAASAFAIEKCWDTIEDTLCDWGLISTAKYEHVGEMFDRMKKLITDVTEMGGHLNVNAAWFLVPANKARWDAARNDVLSLRTDCAATKYTALTGTTFQSELRMLTTRVEALHVQVEGFVGSCGIRICPTGVMFEGPSQIGKSHVTATFIRKVKSRLGELFSAEGLERYPENLDIAQHFHEPQYWATWDQQFRDEYDTGYNGQKIHSIDDMFTQKKGIDQVPLLQFISPKRCGTVQASLEEKGKPYVTQLCIVSCNRPPESSPVITNLDALFNRFPIWVKCSLRQGAQPPTTGHDDTYSWLEFSALSGHDRYANCGIQNEWRDVSLEKLVNATVEDMIDRARQYDQELILERASWQGTPENPLNPVLPTPVAASTLSRISEQVSVWFKHQLGYNAPVPAPVPVTPTTPITPEPMPRTGRPSIHLRPEVKRPRCFTPQRFESPLPPKPAPLLEDFAKFLAEEDEADDDFIPDTYTFTRSKPTNVIPQGPERVIPARLNADKTGLSFVEAPQVIAQHPNGTQLLGTNWVDHLDHCQMCQTFMASAQSASLKRNLSVLLSPLNLPLVKMDLPPVYIQHLVDMSPWQFRSLNGSKIIAHIDNNCVWTVRPWTDPEALAQATIVERTRFAHTQPDDLLQAPGFAMKIYMMIGGWLGWDEHDTIQNYRDFVTRWNTWLSDNKLLMVIFVIVFCLSIIVGLVLNMRETPEVLAEQEKRAKLIADLLREPATATTEAKATFEDTFNVKLEDALDAEEQAVNIGRMVTTTEKLVILCGHGISSLGKGWFGSRIVEGLTRSGKTVKVVKIDPYYNSHAGNFHPSEHGECFVTKEGRECDQDVGSYYRAGATLTKYGAFTGGLAHSWMENTENTEISQCDSLKTAIITEKLREEITGFDYTIVEVGGTVSDTEATCFYDALGRVIKDYNTVSLLLVPEMQTMHGQPKTRVIREGIKQARSRLGHPISAAIVRTRQRNQQMFNIEDTLVFQQPMEMGAYPDTFRTVMEVADTFNIPCTPPEPYATDLKPVKIGLVTKYPQAESHTSLIVQLDKAFCARGMLPTTVPITKPSDLLDERPDYCVVTGGFGRTAIRGLTETVRALHASDIPTLAICLGHQLTYRAVFNYKMEELGERDAEIFRGSKGLRGEYQGHIYRNTFFVRPEPGMFIIYQNHETILKNQAGQKFVAARDWKPTYRSVQYHPEFERLPNEDIEWLASHDVCEQGGGYQGGQRRSTTVLLEEQSIFNAQQLEQSAFRAFMEKPLETVTFNRHPAHARILIATEETAEKMGLKVKYDTLTKLNRKFMYLVHPENVEVELPNELTNLSVPIVVCLASRVKNADGVLYRVWQQLPKAYVRRASPAIASEDVNPQMLPPRSLLLSATNEEYPNQAYTVDELVEKALEQPIDEIVIPPRTENENLYNQVNMSELRGRIQQRFPTRYFQYVEASDIIPIDPRMSFNLNQLLPGQRAAYEPLGERVLKAMCAKYKTLARQSGIPDKSLRDSKVWAALPLEKRSFDIYTKDGTRKKVIIGPETQIERDLEGIRCPSLVKPALDALAVEEQKIRLRYEEKVRDIVERHAEDVVLGELPADETTGSDVIAHGLTDVEAQAGTDPQAISLFHAMVSKVLVGVTPFSMHAPGRVVSGLGGWGYKNKIICPAHLSANCVLGELYRVSKYTYKMPGAKYYNPDEWTLAKLIRVDRANDMMTLELLKTAELKLLFAQGGIAYPKGCQPFSDFTSLIDRHIPSEDDITDRHIATAGAVFTPLSGFMTPGQFSFKRAEPLRMNLQVKYYDVVVVTGLSMSPAVTCQAGDCGGCYIVLNSNWTRKLVGMHTYKAHDSTYAQIVTLERLAKWTGEDVEAQGPEMTAQEMWDDIEEATIDEGAWQWETIDRRPELCDLEPIGPHKEMIGITKFDVGSIPMSTDRLKKSPFYGMFPSTMEPACLSPNDPRITPENREKLLKTRSGKPSILVTQVSDFTCELGENIDEAILDEAINAVMDHEAELLRQQGLPVNAPADVDKVLAEAINGNRQIPGYDKIDPHAGAGALWGACGRSTKGSMLVEPKTEKTKNGPRPNVNRRLWFNPNDNVSKACYQQARSHIELGQKLKTQLSMTTDKLKVETKKREHVEKGKSRTYCDVPFDFMLAVRGLYGRYKNAITQLGPDFYHGLRTNPHSADWSEIANRLAQFDNVYDGDYANFDRHIVAIILMKMYIRECETIRKLHPDDPWFKARLALAHSMLHAYSAVDGCVWRGSRGNKSGSVKTTIDNNKVNLINMVYLWIKITGLTYADFRRYVYMVTFGDDIVWSVHSRFKDIFNFSAIQKGMKELGHTFTPASKDGTEPSGKIEDVTFLKRGFRSEYDGIWFAPLAEGSIWSPFSWTQLPLDDIQGWRNVAESSFRESLLHGAAYYNKVREIYQNFIRKQIHAYPHLYRALIEPSLPTYTEAKRSYMAFAGFTN